MYKRRRLQKTDYKQRLALLRGEKPRLIVRRGINGFRVQLIEYNERGDKVIVEASSRMLKKYGWLGHLGNTPAAYLTGYLAGVLCANKKAAREAVLDIGLQNSVKGSSIYAAVLGAKHAGLNVPLGDVAPPEDRIHGRHVSELAEKLKKESHEKYKKQFSSYLKNGLQPENMHKHFEEVKQKIFSEFKVIKSKEVVIDA